MHLVDVRGLVGEELAVRDPRYGGRVSVGEVIVTTRPRPITVERIGADVYLLRVGNTMLALTYLELNALRYEIDSAT